MKKVQLPEIPSIITNSDIDLDDTMTQLIARVFTPGLSERGNRLVKALQMIDSKTLRVYTNVSYEEFNEETLFVTKLNDSCDELGIETILVTPPETSIE